ncbi:hypothetical protein PG990_006906 [Apiospora arundinis]
MAPVQVGVEIQIDAESHPVFSVILCLCNRESTKNPFEYFSKCPGISISRPKPNECRREHGIEPKARIHAQIRDLNEEASFQYDNPEFVQRINDFLELTHCHDHKKFLRGRLDELIKSMKEEARQGGNEMHPDVDDNEDSNSDKLLTSDSQELVVAEELSSLSISPGQESCISFSSASDADTVLTTPDATPLSQIDSILSCDPESRPETPCPPTCRSSVEVAQVDKLPSRADSLDESDEESYHDQDDQAPYPDAKTMDTSNFKRMTRTIGKLPLLHAIYHHWTEQDSKRGRVYIWRHNRHPDIIKIGWSASAGGGAQRHAQPGNCYAIDTTPVWESAEAFVGAYRVEQIVHGQLKENNVSTKEVACGSPKCAVKGTRHREWFRCDQGVAEKQISLWTELLARGFYEHTICGPDGGDNATSSGMRISATGNQILNQICNILSPDVMLEALKAGAPDGTSPDPSEERLSGDEPAASTGSNDEKLPPLVGGCVGGSAANYGESEPSRRSTDTDLHELHPLSGDISSQEPSDNMSTQEKESPHQSKRDLIKSHFGSVRKSRGGMMDVKAKVRDFISHMPRYKSANNGDGHNKLTAEEDLVARLAVSVFFFKEDQEEYEEHASESVKPPRVGRKWGVGVSLGRGRKSM